MAGDTKTLMQMDIMLRERNHNELVSLIQALVDAINSKDNTNTPEIKVDTKALENSINKLLVRLEPDSSKLTKSDIESIVEKLEQTIKQEISKIKIDIPEKPKVKSIDLVKNINGITTKLKFNY
jgi:hypothetical protein